MFNRKITFSCPKEYLNFSDDRPILAVKNIPEWYKKLKDTYTKKSVKSCKPFMDALTAGYVLKFPQDLYVNFNCVDPQNPNNPEKGLLLNWALKDYYHLLVKNQINLNTHSADIHPINQFEGSPIQDKNKNLPAIKVLNPWKIKTPKGYSCLFIPPLNNSDDRFSIIPGIVDTDSYDLEINFPMYINGNIYDTLETEIKKGTPYVQIIPFKRDEWRSEIVIEDVIEKTNKTLSHFLVNRHNYMNFNWVKKIWK
jgi:hypothetical protein